MTMNTYKINPVHRNGNPEKSQWIIDEAAEKNCWENAVYLKWHDPEGKYVWGLIYTVIEGTEEKQLNTLGITAQYKEESKIARFEHTASTPEIEVWHGYPINYLRRQSDIPHVCVLNMWVMDKFIAKYAMVRLRQCRPCNL